MLFSVAITGRITKKARTFTIDVHLAENYFHSDVFHYSSLAFRDTGPCFYRPNPMTMNKSIVIAFLLCVVGILKGALPGPVVALRADMDALPVKEKSNLPFASTAKAVYNGQETDVMHACGHDGHTAILMGVAEILTDMRKELKGTVVFIFQPAEEGVPKGEEGGAELMVKQGVLDNPKVDVIFGLHMDAQLEVGKISYRPAATMASAADVRITVIGNPSHGASPWYSVDPIVASAQIINGLLH